MTEDEVLHLWARIKVRWPNWKEPEDIALGVEVYLEDLGDHDYKAVSKAYKALRDNAFPPSLGQVVAELEDTGIGEAWMVRKAGTMGVFEKEDPLA